MTNMNVILEAKDIVKTYGYEDNKIYATNHIDLQIEEVDAACGCTTPEWTKEPVKPGEKGKIRVKFDTQHQNLGNKTKQVAVYSNTKPSRNLLQFTAQIVEE